MEKKSFLIYFGVGFLMTLGLWSLMGGCSSEEKREALLKEPDLLKEEVLLPKQKTKPIPPQEDSLVLSPAKASQKKEVSNKIPSPSKKPVKMVQEEQVIEYVVSKGDTLWGISQRYGTVIEKIMKLNKLESMNVRVGQRLKIKTNVLVEKVIEPVGVSQSSVEKIIEPAVVSQPPVENSKPSVVSTKPLPMVQQEEKPEPAKMAEKKPEPYIGELLTYEVKDGESLIHIAEIYKTTQAFLLDINGLTEHSELQAGQILLVPEK